MRFQCSSRRSRRSRIELDDAVVRVDGQDFAHAELRRFLYYEIHCVGFRERLHERNRQHRLGLCVASLRRA